MHLARNPRSPPPRECNETVYFKTVKNPIQSTTIVGVNKNKFQNENIKKHGRKQDQKPKYGKRGRPKREERKNVQ